MRTTTALYLMKTTPHEDSRIFFCFPETEFEKELFGCDYIVIKKDGDSFVFWYETPDLSHLKEGERVSGPSFNPDNTVDLPEEFRCVLEEELSGGDGMAELAWNDSLKQWELH